MQLPSKIADWPKYYAELYEERAGIYEFEGKMSRKNAELQAEKDIRKLALWEKLP